MEEKLLKKIIELRNILNIDQLTMAYKMGISLKKYQLFEKGEIRLTNQELNKCLEILNINNLYERYNPDVRMSWLELKPTNI